MTSEVRRLFATLVQEGHLREQNLIGCTKEDIATITAHFGTPLPSAYLDFLSIAGRGAGKLFQGTDIFFPRLLELQKGAEELLRELGKEDILPQDAKVFCLHQGYEFDFFTAGDAARDDDPPVYQFVEGEAGATLAWPTFSNFLSTAIQSHTTHWPDLN